MISIITEYQYLKKAIPAIVEASGYRNDYLAKKIGMTPTYFSVKKQRGNWNEEEVKRILDIILHPSNDEIEDLILLQIMKAREEDLEEISFDDYKKEVAGWK